MEETKNVHPNKKNSANIFLKKFVCKEKKPGSGRGRRWWRAPPRLPPRPAAARAAGYGAEERQWGPGERKAREAAMEQMLRCMEGERKK